MSRTLRLLLDWDTASAGSGFRKRDPDSVSRRTSGLAVVMDRLFPPEFLLASAESRRFRESPPDAEAYARRPALRRRGRSFAEFPPVPIRPWPAGRGYSDRSDRSAPSGRQYRKPVRRPSRHLVAGPD